MDQWVRGSLVKKAPKLGQRVKQKGGNHTLLSQEKGRRTGWHTAIVSLRNKVKEKTQNNRTCLATASSVISWGKGRSAPERAEKAI